MRSGRASTFAAPPIVLHVANVLAWGTLIFLIPLASVLGSAGSILASICTIALVPFTITRNGWGLVRREPAMLIFVGVFLALGTCFLFTARTPRDPVYVFNFVSLPLAAVVFVVAQRSARADAAATLIALCLAAVLVALAVGINDIFLRQLPFIYSFNLGPHVVARIALVFAFIPLAGLFVTNSPWRFVCYLGPLAGVIVLYLSNTRGAFLALPVMVLVFAAFLWGDRRQRWQFWVLLSGAFLVVAALAVTSDRFASIAAVALDIASGRMTSDASTGQRLEMLGAAWQLFLASPVNGYGWANFASIAHPIIGHLVAGPADTVFQFHNDLANFAVAAGGIGVLCWAALLTAPVLGALASPRDPLFRVRLYCCLQLSASYFVFGLTDFTLGYDLPTTLYAFLTAVVLGAFREPASALQNAA